MRKTSVQLTLAHDVRAVPRRLAFDGVTFGVGESGRDVTDLALVEQLSVQVEGGLREGRVVAGVLDLRRASAVDCAQPTRHDINTSSPHSHITNIQGVT